ncbi:TlpA family protein disulfide reductase [Candidatus Woesearchaeota archaeon]|nr:TlpA family protein disulfide reductase [Candidatus Woesearchaeota archaeon]
MQEIKIKKSYLVTGVIIILVLTVFFFAPKFTGNAVKETTNSSGSAQDFSLQTTSGETITLSQFKGKVVILQAMASWCPSCKLQAQQIKPLYEKYANDGLIVISLDIQPERSSLQELKNFKANFGGDWYFGFYPEFINLYGIRSLDSKVIIDKNGNIAYRDDMITTTEKLDEVIGELL